MASRKTSFFPEGKQRPAGSNWGSGEFGDFGGGATMTRSIIPGAFPFDITAVGIDVGARRKGFHAVAIAGGHLADCLAVQEVEELSRWCRKKEAQVIAIDAPCRWSSDGHSRPAERALMQRGIFCFSTPTRERAEAHPKDYFGWMINGMALYRALADRYPLCATVSASNQPCCFETFPHAITWRLRGGRAVASRKRKERRELLEMAGIDLSPWTNIDFIDAALCALAAYHAAMGGACEVFGEPATGMIIVPERFTP